MLLAVRSLLAGLGKRLPDRRSSRCRVLRSHVEVLAEQVTPGASRTMSRMVMVRIAHMSDFHVAHTTSNLSRMWRLVRPLRRGEGLSDVLSHMVASSWVERRSLFEPFLRAMNLKSHYSSRALLAALESARNEGVDHLIMTGDAANLGAWSEMLEARALLQATGWWGEKLTIVPGNHDVVNFHGVAQFGRVFGAGPWPALQRIRADVAVVGLDTSVHGKELDWRDMLTMNARGRIAPRSIEKTQQLLRSLPRDTFKIVCCHHHLVDLPPDSYVDEWSGKVDPRLAGPAERSEELLDVAQAEGVGLILFGHRHRATHHLFTIRGIPAACSGATTAPGPDGWLRYRVFDIEGGKILRRRWIRVHPRSASMQRVRELLSRLPEVPAEDEELPKVSLAIDPERLEEQAGELRERVKEADRRAIEKFREKLKSYTNEGEQ